MRMPTMTPPRTLFLEMLALAALAALLAAGMNALRPAPLPWLGSGDPAAAEALALAGHVEQPVESAVDTGPRTLSAAAFSGLVASGQAVVVDARMPEDYAAGHVPGAVNVPPGLMDDEIAAIIGPPPGDKPLVVYCSDPACPLSGDLAFGLGLAGYEGVRIFEGGMQGWLDAGGRAEVAP